MALGWSELSCTLQKKKGGAVENLLVDARGRAEPGRLLAIMGPSGAGKTTLLHALAARLQFTPGMTLEGIVTANGQPFSGEDVHVGFVKQEDVFYSMLTVRVPYSPSKKTGAPCRTLNLTSPHKKTRA